MVPGRDGYAYFFNSVAEGPMMSTMTLKHILVLLHVINSFIPEECILETEYLKPSFNDQGGLEKLVEKIPLSDEEWDQARAQHNSMRNLAVCDVPMDQVFNTMMVQDADDDVHQEGARGRKKRFRTRPVPVAEILVAPVCVAYDTIDGNGKNTCFWLVILKTRKCYNFNEHLRWMINKLDKEDKSHIKKTANREYEEIMYMMREVVLHQYENSPDCAAYLREQVR